MKRHLLGVGVWMTWTGIGYFHYITIMHALYTHQGFVQDFLLGGEQHVEVPAHSLSPPPSGKKKVILETSEIAFQDYFN